MVHPALNERQQLRGKTRRPRTNFQNAQSTPFRQLTSRLLNRTRDRCHPVTCQKPVTIKLIQQLGTWPAKQNLHSILLAAQDRTQFRASRFTQQSFRQMPRMILNKVPQEAIRRLCRLSKSGRRLELAPFARQQPASYQLRHQPSKDRLHSRRNTQRFRAESSLELFTHSHRRQPGRNLRRSQFILRPQNPLKLLTSTNTQNLFEGGSRRFVKLFQRHRSNLRRSSCHLRPFPIHVIQQVTPAS